MKERFTARFFIGKKIFTKKNGDDVDELYNWLLVKAQGQLGDLNGNVTDNETKKIIKSFRKCSPD